MSDMDLDKLIRDIIGPARGEAIANLNRLKSFAEKIKQSVTSTIEVIITKKSTQLYQDNQQAPENLFY